MEVVEMVLTRFNVLGIWGLKMIDDCFRCVELQINWLSEVNLGVWFPDFYDLTCFLCCYEDHGVIATLVEMVGERRIKNTIPMGELYSPNTEFRVEQLSSLIRDECIEDAHIEYTWCYFSQLPRYLQSVKTVLEQEVNCYDPYIFL
jgi:hypothetical protein